MGELLRALFRRRPLLKKRGDRTVTFTLKELMEFNPMLLMYPELAEKIVKLVEDWRRGGRGGDED